MILTKTFWRVLTHSILPIAAGILLLSIWVDEARADIEHTIEKPTLLSRTPPFIPDNRIFFKRETEKKEDEGQADEGEKKAVDDEAKAESSSSLDEKNDKTTKDADEKSDKGSENDSKESVEKDNDEEKSEAKDVDGSAPVEEANVSNSTKSSSKISDDEDFKSEGQDKAKEASEGSRTFHLGFNKNKQKHKWKTSRPAPAPEPPQPPPTQAPPPPPPPSRIPPPPPPPPPRPRPRPTKTPPPPPRPPTIVPPPPRPPTRVPTTPPSDLPSTLPPPPPPPTPPPSVTTSPPDANDPQPPPTSPPTSTPTPNPAPTPTPTPTPTPDESSTIMPSTSESPEIRMLDETFSAQKHPDSPTIPPKKPHARPGSIETIMNPPDKPSKRPHLRPMVVLYSTTNPNGEQRTSTSIPNITLSSTTAKPNGMSGSITIPKTLKPNLHSGSSTTYHPAGLNSSTTISSLPSPTKPVAATTPRALNPSEDAQVKPIIQPSVAPPSIPSTSPPPPPTAAKIPGKLNTTTTISPSPTQLIEPPTQQTTGTNSNLIPADSNSTSPVGNSTNEGNVIHVHRASKNAKQPDMDIINNIANRINPNITRNIVNPDAGFLLDFNQTMFDARDVAYFLESHPAHSIHDPRVYFTSERTTRSLVILLQELKRVPEKLRFAFMIRVFNELGRKIASKLNYYAIEIGAILKRGPDGLGNKPEVSQLVDAVNSAFESKDDTEINGDAEVNLEFDNYLKKFIDSNDEKKGIYMAAMKEISKRFAQLMSHFVLKSTSTTSGSAKNVPLIKIPSSGREKLPILLGESLKSGAKMFILETAYDDRFRIPLDVIGFTNLILNDTISLMTQHLMEKNLTVSDSIRRDFDESMNVNSFKDLNALSDKIGLIGSWNSLLFANLGTTERLIKVFGSFMTRVPLEVKARWINMYMEQIHLELERTISAFVVMQGMPYHGDASEKYLLNPERTIELIPNKVPTIRDNYLADKNRIPARCYLAGRRWRLVMSRGLEKFEQKEEVLDSLANRIGAIKNRMIDQSGNDIYRLCLPRLEVGIRGWSIDGQPEGADTNKKTEKFPLKNPIDGLTEMRDPFASGVLLGFGIGVRVGYNEERNATLEMERASHEEILNSNAFNSTLGLGEIEYVAMASYRRAATVAGRKAFEIAIREGYLTTLKISVRSGMNIPVETGSRISALKAVSMAGQAGQDAGKAAAEAFILERKLSDDMKKKLIQVGRMHGLLAGEIAGESIGLIVGKAAAEEAYRRSIIRGGKVARAKFHLEEFEAGAKLGFEYGLKEGKKIASSSTLDPSAPRFFRLHKPVFSTNDKPDHEVDLWEKELIPPLTDEIIANLASVRDHTPVSGSLRGRYKVAKEVKAGFKRISYSNVTYDLEVFAKGFIKSNIAYLTLNGTVNKMGILRGSLIARDIFNDNQDE